MKKLTCSLILTILISLAAAEPSKSQESKVPAKNSTQFSGTSQSIEESDLISVGDTLDIRVFNRPQMSREAVRVNPDGKIKMPFLEDPIQAACQTERSLADEITRQYRTILKAPQVEVFIKEYQTLPFVAVLGEVRTPSRLQLQKGKQIRLLEALAYVGGPGEQAGNRIQVIHTGKTNSCSSLPTARSINELTEDSEIKPNFYNLKYTLTGDVAANPYIKSGDIIILPEAEQVFVIGSVVKPTNLLLSEPLTVTQAIAMSGGLLPNTNREKIRILRQLPDSAEKKEILINLRDVEAQKTPDTFLEPNDVIDVPVNGNQVFVVGNVLKPSTFVLSEPLTVTKVIAMAGGLLADTSRDKIRILRQQPNSNDRKEIIVSINDIEKQKTPDVLLEPNDIIDVSVNGGKRLLRSILERVAPSIAQLPIRVIP